MILSYSNFKKLNEVGEGTANVFSYKLLKSSSNSVVYEFDSNYYNYKVPFMLETIGLDLINLTDEHPYYKYDLHKIYSCQFYISNLEDTTNASGYTVVTNKNELYKIMATMVAIIQEFITNHPGVGISFIPAKNSADDMRRAKLYYNYIQYHISGDYTFITLKASDIYHDYDEDADEDETFIFKK